jgi:hypothetical protein
MGNGDYIYIAKSFKFHGANLEAGPSEVCIFLASDTRNLLVMSDGEKVGRAIWIGKAEISGETHNAMILALPRQVVENDNMQICYTKQAPEKE